MDLTTDPRTNLSPQLYGYASMHDAITRDCARLESTLGHLVPGDPSVGARLVRWFDRFEAVIVHHHGGEDDLVFPLLVERDPSFDPEALTVDHHILDDTMEKLRAGLAALATDANGAARAHSLRAATDLRTLMADHLDREEAAVFPRMLEFVSAEEHAEIELQLRKGLKFSTLTFGLPWILDEADPDIATHIRADLPFPLLVLNTLRWDRSYRRLAAPVRDGSNGRANI
ncbi:MAG TPA: hemerythrin domain-containing protein [Microthrixaceae bacterium]|nr:hemerythrin domain-containing protein [Microthrixaceae bacterium]